MGTAQSVPGHLLDVAIILALGLVYVVALSVGTVTSAIKRVGVSAWRAGGSVARRTTRSTH